MDDIADVVFSIIVFIAVILLNIAIICGFIWFAIWLASLYF